MIWVCYSGHGEPVARKSSLQYAEILERNPNLSIMDCSRWQDVRQPLAQPAIPYFYEFMTGAWLQTEINHNEGDWEMVALFEEREP